MKQRSYNLLGNIALVNFPRKFKGSRKKFAEGVLDRNKSVKTVLEKSGNFKGRLRKMKTKFLAGEKTKEVLYKENNCTFRFNIDTTYFSPRLSNERREIASLVKPKEKVLVMFAGVAPFSVVIAKNSKAEKVYSNEINREANKYGRLNAELNKLKDKIEFVDGDIKKIAEKIARGNFCSCPPTRPLRSSQARRAFINSQKCSYVPKKFDFIIMPRPQLKESFLKQAFMLSKKGTRIYYYDFCKSDKISLIVEKIKIEAKKFRKKIKILKTKPAGEIAPYKIRCRIDFLILN